MLYFAFSDLMTEAIHGPEPRIESSRVIQMQLATIIYRQIEMGWAVFSATASLLKLGAIVFVATLSAFIVSGIGIIAVAVLAIVGFGAYEGKKYLYAKKWYPLSILMIGSVVKPECESYRFNDDDVSQLLVRNV